MRCFEDAASAIMGTYVPSFAGENWAAEFKGFARRHGFLARFVEIDSQAIVSRRLPNGKVHADVMHPTLITVLEKLK